MIPMPLTHAPSARSVDLFRDYLLVKRCVHYPCFLEYVSDLKVIDQGYNYADLIFWSRFDAPVATDQWLNSKI